MRPTICVMLKAPRPGEVKTRLGREIGQEESCRAYRQLAEHQLDQIAPGWPIEIHYAPAEALVEMQSWLGLGYTYIAQCEGDLGDRLRAAMLGAFDRGAAGVLIIGGDCPYITGKILEETTRHLLSHDVVIGPAEDGGYYLLATQSAQPRLFEKIDWSTERVFGQTMNWLRRLNLSSAILPTLSDVDDLACWKKAQAVVKSPHRPIEPVHAPRIESEPEKYLEKRPMRKRPGKAASPLKAPG
jgi:rSAM/selenodomain-associated transferase 1